MPFVFSDEPNELVIQDNLSGQEVALYYRLPTTEERVAFASESVRRKGKKVEFRGAAVRVKYGLAILSGLRKGDFVRKQADGVLVPVSSDPGDEHYAADWKQLVAKHAPHLVDLLAVQVFEAAASVKGAEAGDEAEAEEGSTAGES